MTRRDSILEGTAAAQRLHAALGTRKAIERGELARIDVFQIALREGAFLLFRPLKGLLGAYLGKPQFPQAGIIISTQRDLHVQRFTAAHELGHMAMGHTPSLDGEEIGLWRAENSDPQEVAADAFASEFLLPRWLYIFQAARYGWTSKKLVRPDIVYQLSLRLGASYDATCWGLQGHKILSQSAVDELRKYEPKVLKQEAQAGPNRLTNPWADVWVVNERDNGAGFEGTPDDIVIFRCQERASAGYLWDEEQLKANGFEILADQRELPSEIECGGEVTRILITRVQEPREYKVGIVERRPWQPDDSPAQLSMSFDLQGKEQGLPRAARKTIATA